MLDTLEYLRHETDVWFEITTLLIPGHNDSDAEIAEECAWLVEHLGPDVPLHFTAFHPDFKMRDVPRTPPETLRRARRIALEHGLRYVYTGNVHDPDGQTTRCPGCGEAVVVRDWYVMQRLPSSTTPARASTAARRCPGVYDGPVGTWGARRLPVADRGGGDRDRPARAGGGRAVLPGRPGRAGRRPWTTAARRRGRCRRGRAARRAAYVVPHAGYRYSGPDRAHVYARLRAARRPRCAGSSSSGRPTSCRCAAARVPAADAWRTPLGRGRDRRRRRARRWSAPASPSVDDAPHAPEHSLEVQLPFLQRALGPGAAVLPIAVGVCVTWTAVAARRIARGRRTRADRYGGDLQHRPVALPGRGDGRRQDERTVRAVVDLAPDGSASRDACGVYALRGLLGWARRTGLTADVLHRCTSADTAGDTRRGWSATRRSSFSAVNAL